MTDRVFISPVGTSLLTNGASNSTEIGSLLLATANLREDEIGPDQLRRIKERCDEVRKVLSMADSAATVRRLSAELNGIYTYCGLKRVGGADEVKRDLHFLIATDTFQGRMTAEIVQEHILSLGAGAQVLCPPNLSAKDRGGFAAGVTDLIKWCEETLPGYGASGYRVIFNLVGGFKGVQGYLNTLGMFYADEIFTFLRRVISSGFHDYPFIWMICRSSREKPRYSRAWPTATSQPMPRWRASRIRFLKWMPNMPG